MVGFDDCMLDVACRCQGDSNVSLFGQMEPGICHQSREVIAVE